MTEKLEERLNRIPDRLISEGFCRGSGIGNEVAFYVFDYPPEAELRIREYIPFLINHLGKLRPELRVKHINLLPFVIDLLNGRGFLGKAYSIQKRSGDAALIKELTGAFAAEKIASAFAALAQPVAHDIIIASGAGSVWPMVRTHGLLSALQPHLGLTPLVLFYPGIYDGQSLRLFGKLSSNYYRAFKLIP